MYSPLTPSDSCDSSLQDSTRGKDLMLQLSFILSMASAFHFRSSPRSRRHLKTHPIMSCVLANSSLYLFMYLCAT